MEVLLAHCAQLFSQQGGFFSLFFVGGLTGSLTHCIGMCGSLVACQSACAGGSACSKRASWAAAGQLPYHLGRMTTYGALGFAAALLSKQIAAFAVWPDIAAAMLALAGLMFVASSLPACKHSLFRLPGKLGYMRGVLLGFMPCGLLYAALMMAATVADPLGGMLAMWLFTLGTMPALLLVGAGTQLLTIKWQGAMRSAGRALMAFNGLSLLVMAEKLVR